MYQQPYDTSMKAMLQEDAPEIVSQLLPGAIFINADPSLLIQALEELIVYHKDNEAKLIRRVLWFSTLLKHIEKDFPQTNYEKVRKRLDLFDKLLEENDLVIRQRALGLEEGERKGKKEGEIQSSQQILLDILQARYPALVELVEPRITQTTDFDTLRKTIKLLFNATNEQNAYQVLDALLAQIEKK